MKIKFHEAAWGEYSNPKWVMAVSAKSPPPPFAKGGRELGERGDLAQGVSTIQPGALYLDWQCTDKAMSQF